MNIKLAFATFAIAAAAAFAPAQTPLHVTVGNGLIDGILSQAANNKFYDEAGVLTNRYGGTTSSYYIHGPTQEAPDTMFGAYGKCAPYVTMLLKECYGWVPSTAIGNSPSAKLYYEIIRDSSYGFTKRASFTDWKVGDILASGYYDNSNSTGHVMVMLNATEFANDQATKTREYWVQVMDCSDGIHTNDTRSLFSTLNQGGVGRGIIRVKTVDNQIKAWAWSNLGGYYSETGRPITLGKFNAQTYN